MRYAKELLTPSGDVYVSTSPRETNDLIYGSGYREVGQSNPAPGEPDTADPYAGDEYAYGGEVTS